MSEHITVASDAFAEVQKNPSLRTCDGQDLSPRIMVFDLPPGTKTWGNSRYQGPCPPSGSHPYFFKVFAQDCTWICPAGPPRPNSRSDPKATHWRTVC